MKCKILTQARICVKEKNTYLSHLYSAKTCTTDINLLILISTFTMFTRCVSIFTFESFKIDRPIVGEVNENDGRYG